MRAFRIRAVALAAASAAVVAIGGCGDSGEATSPGRPSVLAAFYPYYFLAQRIGGDDVAVTNLTQSGVEPHDLELTPRQVGAIAAADLVVYQRGFQPAVDEAVAQNRSARVLEVGSLVPPLGDADQHGAGHRAAQGDGHGGGQRGGHGGEQGDTGSDPHAWLDPDRFAVIANAVGEELSRVDAPHAAGYRARATSLASQLEALDQEITAGLQSCRSRVIVTNHAAFGYLAAKYDLEQIPISGNAPDAEPSPARIKAVMQAVRTRNVTTIFFETLVSPKAAQTLARDVGVRTAVLDPVEGLADPASADYFSVMRANLDALRKALSCT